MTRILHNQYLNIVLETKKLGHSEDGFSVRKIVPYGKFSLALLNIQSSHYRITVVSIPAYHINKVLVVVVSRGSSHSYDYFTPPTD